MAELLVRVVDKVNDDPYLDCHCTKRGDVIVIAPDGWSWGREELTNPHWRIVKAPNISVDDASAFLGPELETNPQNPSRVRQKRGFKLGLERLPPNWALWLADDTRAQPTKTFNGAGAALLAMKARKPALADPNVMG